MISIENARRLKELGLKDTPETITHDMFVVARLKHYGLNFTLSQLLAEIEKRGYSWNVHTDPTAIGWYGIGCYQKYDHFGKHGLGDTPEDAAALALIAILEGEKG